jgi:predicted RNA-binding protein (virulence factor B family)
MLLVGRHNRLTISRINATGAFLATDEGDVLLPGKFIPAGAEPGMDLDVFIYCDSEDRLVATTQTPKTEVGEFALLRVTDTHDAIGAFLDWGLDKDLLLPFAEQTSPANTGEQVLVRLYLDQSGRIAASGRLEKFLQPADGSLNVGDEVRLMAYGATDLGVKVIINNRYGGLLFRTELYDTPARGHLLTGYVRKIRTDGKIDVTLRKGGAHEAMKDRELILTALKTRDGFLSLTDKSAPEEIAGALHLSKKSFKKAVGGLYKEGLIAMTAEGIRLRRKPEH